MVTNPLYCFSYLERNCVFMVFGIAEAARVCYLWSHHGAEEVQDLMLDSNKLKGNNPP